MFVSSVVCNDDQWVALKFGATLQDYIGPFRYEMSPFRDSLSISMWVRRVHKTPYPVVFDYEPGNEIMLGSNGHHNFIAGGGNVIGWKSKFNSTEDGIWFHYCITYSPSSGINLYLDGVLIGSTPGSGRGLRMGGTLFFNRLSYADSGDWATKFVFGGELYQFNIFSGVLSATSVQKIAQGGLCFDLDQEFSAMRALRWDYILERPRSGNVRNVMGCREKAWDALFLKSQEMLANAVGRLNETEAQLETMIRQFNSTASELHVTKDGLDSTKEHFESVAKELHSAKEDLRAMAEVFNSTKEDLGVMVKEFNSTKEDIGGIANEFNCAKDLGAMEQELSSTKEALGAMAKQLNSTKEALAAKEKELNSAKKDLGAKASELNSTNEDLEVVRTRLNRTEAQLETETELLESCSATLTDSQNQLKNSRTFQNITRWDILYTRPYYNHQFTDELYEKLTTSWEMLSKLTIIVSNTCCTFCTLHAVGRRVGSYVYTYQYRTFLIQLLLLYVASLFNQNKNVLSSLDCTSSLRH